LTEEDPASRYVSNRPIKRPDSASFDLATHWIDDCLETHEHCPGPELPVLPTRIIDVGATNGDGPKLILSKGQRARYATLSYCWGGPQPFTLTLATIASKLQGLSYPETPLAFRDAIHVARQLDIQYLWIDALCIIQDSEVDKAVEMAAMDQVYHNATVTIAAANVKGCSESFLTTWVPRCYPNSVGLAKINFPCPDGETGNIFAEYGPGYSPSDEPLSKRGWALQERLLSPGVLTFSSHQMWWHCQTAQHSEGGGYNDDFVIRGGLMDRLGYDFFQQKGQSRRSTGTNELYENWGYLVANYANLHLTVRTDTLPALSGIATRYARVLNDTYYAGLWRKDLLRFLAWFTAHPEEDVVRRHSEYRAPTWSWASIDTFVNWEQSNAKMDVLIPTEVLHCQIEPVHPMAPFEEVRAGVLELRGLVRDLDWDGDSELRGADDYIMIEALADMTVETLNVDADGQGQQQMDFRMNQDVRGVNPILRRVSCIPVTDHFSLMLDRQRDGEYVRLGVVKFWQMDDNEGQWEAAVNRFYEDATVCTVVIR
jgi:Heterokaryon incompatibility protein (HET)